MFQAFIPETGRGIQGAKMFDITFTNKEGKSKRCGEFLGLQCHNGKKILKILFQFCIKVFVLAHMELTIEVSNICFEDWSDDIDLWR